MFHSLIPINQCEISTGKMLLTLFLCDRKQILPQTHNTINSIPPFLPLSVASDQP